MPIKPQTHAAQLAAQRRRRAESARPNARQRGYVRSWESARRRFLAEYPLCAECQRNGRIVPAEVVDHIQPHRGDRAVFWDRGNWQSLCRPCHDRKTARGE